MFLCWPQERMAFFRGDVIAKINQAGIYDGHETALPKFGSPPYISTPGKT
jgi:hypothetical protein